MIYAQKTRARGWQRFIKGCQQLGPEFRHPLIKKKYEIILKIFGGKN
jgi:hypothetical protein